MSKVFVKRKRGFSFRFSAEERGRLKNLTDAELETRALADPDNPPLKKQQLDRMALAREVRLVRGKIGGRPC